MPKDSFRGVLFPALLVSPLPSKLPGGTSCAECDKPQALWFLQALPGMALICSWCVLYTVPWEGKDAEDIRWFIAVVEATQDRVFEKDIEGRLLCCSDADRLVTSLVLTSKVLVTAGKVIR